MTLYRYISRHHIKYTWNTGTSYNLLVLPTIALRKHQTTQLSAQIWEVILKYIIPSSPPRSGHFASWLHSFKDNFVHTLCNVFCRPRLMVIDSVLRTQTGLANWWGCWRLMFHPWNELHTSMQWQPQIHTIMTSYGCLITGGIHFRRKLISYQTIYHFRGYPALNWTAKVLLIKSWHCHEHDPSVSIYST